MIITITTSPRWPLVACKYNYHLQRLWTHQTSQSSYWLKHSVSFSSRGRLKSWQKKYLDINRALEQGFQNSCVYMEMRADPPKKLGVMIIHKNGDYWQFWQLISFLNTNCGGSRRRGGVWRLRLAAVDWWHLSSLHSGLSPGPGLQRLAAWQELSLAHKRRPRVDIIGYSFRLWKRV